MTMAILVQVLILNVLHELAAEYKQAYLSFVPMKQYVDKMYPLPNSKNLALEIILVLYFRYTNSIL